MDRPILEWCACGASQGLGNHEGPRKVRNMDRGSLIAMVRRNEARRPAEMAKRSGGQDRPGMPAGNGLRSTRTKGREDFARARE